MAQVAINPRYMLDQEKISKSYADFYALEQLIIHSFLARVCALLWCRLALWGQGL